MSIAADIKQARAAFEDHVATHKCRPAVSCWNDNQDPCDLRATLWLVYMKVAARWGQEPTDEQRQRDHFNRNLRPAAA